MAPRAGSLVRSRVFGNLHEEEEILFAKFVLSAACQHQRNPLSICYTTYLPQEHSRPGTSNSFQCLLEQPSYRMHFTCAACRELHSGYFQSRDGLPPTPASQHDLSAPPALLKRRPLGPDHAIIQRAAEVSSRTPCSMSPPSLPLVGSSTRSDQPLQNPQAPGILSHVHTSVRTASVFIYPDLPKPVGHFFFSS